MAIAHGRRDKQALLDLISGLGIDKDKGNNASTATAFYEAYQWFTGGKVYLGNKTATKHDPKAFTDGSKTVYQPPGLGCARNHIIYLANGSPQDNNTSALALLQRLNPKMTRFGIPVAEGVSNSDEANRVDEAAAFLNNGADLDGSIEGAQNITTHAIAVTGSSSDGNYPNFIRWIAKQGGGLYQQASTTDGIIVAMTKILNQIRASNSVFSSASLPVSANTQGTYLNQVYIGMFRPDGNALPRWVGNLKQYQFLYNAQTDSLQLADANKVPAVSSTTGFIDLVATSFWTKPSTFWLNVETASSGKYSRSDMPDGEKVEKGGAAQLLRETYLTSTSARRIYTCKGYGCDNDVDLVAAGKDYQFSPYLEPLKDFRNDFSVISGLSHPDVGSSHDSIFSFLTAARHPEIRAGFRNSISLDGKRELDLMKPTAILINSSRGPVVDEKALVEALKKGKIAGAGLDVYEKEPLLYPGLAKLENVVLLPHIGSATQDTRGQMAVLAVKNAVLMLRGKRPKTIVNPDVLESSVYLQKLKP